ncbi:MAG TPA: hypothetical protein VFU47_03990, partial [Armatimonadota bacterium]|nr:hypothetical protein [Armatimonadota bacterium]
KDNMEFDASHSLFATTNYIPVVSETDHGTWRRLALVRFPFTYVKKDVPITDPDIQRRGDPTLKNRVKNNTEGQHDAIVTWAVEGARRFFANREELERDPEAADIMNLPARVAADTLEWRKDADRILAYWTECLVADPRAAAYAPDLLDHFNEWMTANGHNPWPKETFSTRFAGHAMTTSARVKRARTRDHSAIVRRPVATTWVGPGALKALPKQADVWVGVRYRTDGDSA